MGVYYKNGKLYKKVRFPNTPPRVIPPAPRVIPPASRVIPPASRVIPPAPRVIPPAPRVINKGPIKTTSLIFTNSSTNNNILSNQISNIFPLYRNRKMY